MVSFFLSAKLLEPEFQKGPASPRCPYICYICYICPIYPMASIDPQNEQRVDTLWNNNFTDKKMILLDSRASQESTQQVWSKSIAFDKNWSRLHSPFWASLLTSKFYVKVRHILPCPGKPKDSRSPIKLQIPTKSKKIHDCLILIKIKD